ncbi:MAG: hypothetical protein AVDCRST_MAG52-2463, partial [uncultured Blastococcus sp.]
AFDRLSSVLQRRDQRNAAGRQPPAHHLRGLRPRVAAGRGAPRPRPPRRPHHRLAARRLPHHARRPPRRPGAGRGPHLRLPARPPGCRPRGRRVPGEVHRAVQPGRALRRPPGGPAGVRDLRHPRQRRQHVRPQPRVEDPGRGQGGAEGPRVDRVPAARAREPAPGGPAHPADRRQEGRLPLVQQGAPAHQGALRRRARAVPAGPALLGPDRRQEGDRQARLRAGPPAGREGRVDDRPAGRVEQRPAPLAGRQRHPRPAAGRGVPRLGEDPSGALPRL